MRIAQYSDSFLPVVDGVGRVVFSYAETLGMMGHQSYVCAPRDEMGDLEGYHFQVIDYTTMPMPGKMPYRIGFPGLDAHMKKNMGQIELDIVHVHSPFMSGYSGLHLAKKRNLPVVGSFHSKYYDDFKQKLKLDSFARIGVKQVVDFYQACDEVWAVSKATGKTLIEYGYQGDVVTMENGTEIRSLDKTVLPELRARFSIREDVPVLLYVGQLNWKKNILRILEAARLLADSGIQFQLLLAGQGPHREAIAEEAEKLSLSGQVCFTGHLQSTRELDGLYALAKLLVFPSLYDNAPMVVREAAVMSTPPVLIAGSNAAECVLDGVNGLTCLDDAQALADTIAGALADEALLVRMGEAARETIPVPWTVLMEQVAGRYEALIRAKSSR